MNIKEIHELMELVAKLQLEEVTIKTPEMEVIVKGKAAPSTSLEPYLAQLASSLRSAPAVPSQTVMNIEPTTGPPSIFEESEKTTTTEAPATSNAFIITSPIVGTFYITPAPSDPPFTQVGEYIKPKQILCIVEAMKIFNEIESEVSGKVLKILVENGNPVEFGQPLFEVELSE